MIEQVFKANVRSFQEINSNVKNQALHSINNDINNSNFSPFKSTPANLKSNVILSDHLSNKIDNDMNSLSSISLMSHSTNNKPFSTNTTTFKSINNIKSNDSILAERMKIIMQPITKLGSTGSMPVPSSNSHLKYKK